MRRGNVYRMENLRVPAGSWLPTDVNKQQFSMGHINGEFLDYDVSSKTAQHVQLIPSYARREKSTDIDKIHELFDFTKHFPERARPWNQTRKQAIACLWACSIPDRIRPLRKS